MHLIVCTMTRTHENLKFFILDLDLLYCHSTNTPSVHILKKLRYLGSEWSGHINYLKYKYSQNIKYKMLV